MQRENKAHRMHPGQPVTLCRSGNRRPGVHQTPCHHPVITSSISHPHHPLPLPQQRPPTDGPASPAALGAPAEAGTTAAEWMFSPSAQLLPAQPSRRCTDSSSWRRNRSIAALPLDHLRQLQRKAVSAASRQRPARQAALHE
jgi:hypothetical protein